MKGMSFMNYTPNDIQNLEFKKSMRGFDEDMVNDVLDKIIEDYSNYIHENIELKDRIGVLSEGIQHYKNIEDSLQETLVIAQQTSEEIKKNAQDKADLIIREAEMRAQGIINEASKDSTQAKFQYDEIKNKMYMFKVRTESLLSSQLEMLKQMFDEDEDPVKQAVKNSEKLKEKEDAKKLEAKKEFKKDISETKVTRKIQEIDENENIEITEVMERD
jgi:cell division initiation protein